MALLWGNATFTAQEKIFGNTFYNFKMSMHIEEYPIEKDIPIARKVCFIYRHTEYA